MQNYPACRVVRTFILSHSLFAMEVISSGAFVSAAECIYMYSKTCVKPPLSKRPKFGFQNQLLLNAGQKYSRMLQGEHSALLLTFIKLPFVIKIFVYF